MTHAMIWHSLRCGRLKSMSDTLLLLYSLCGFPACVTTRQLGVKSLRDRLCSRPDLYVISVLSDHLPRHMFLWIISDELTGQWHSCGAGISASCKCVCRGCGGESTWRGGSGSLCWLSDARCRPLSSMCQSLQNGAWMCTKDPKNPPDAAQALLTLWGGRLQPRPQMFGWPNPKSRICLR